MYLNGFGGLVVMKTKVFAWVLLVDRLNTRDLLQRRHWNVTDVYHCELFPLRVHEDGIHMFFECNFNVRVWNYLPFKCCLMMTCTG
jgi:hypothetical protein